MTIIVAKRRRIPLSDVAREALSNTDDSPDLDPRDCGDPPIVVDEGRGYQIVDGFHRIAGMANWAEAEGKTNVRIDVIDVSDSHEAIIAAAADPSGYKLTQETALEMIADSTE
jgi:hypothetical protein